MHTDKIAIDFTFVSEEEIRKRRLSCSIPVFLSDLLDEISAQGYANDFIIISNSNAYNLLKERFPKFDFISIGGLVAKASFLFFGKQMNGFFRKKHVLENILIKNGIKHIWYPYMLPETVLGGKIEYIGTCHDLMRLNDFDSYYKIFFESRQIITVSNYVKKEIVEKFKVDESRITVIHNSIKPIDSGTEPSFLMKKIKNEFILDINAYLPRKNTLTILKAFDLLKDQIAHDLVLCGGYKDEEYYQKCAKYVKDNHLENRVHMLLAVSDAERNWLFENCKLFVMPSENEGFGRTPIEAAICLKPVISTRVIPIVEATCDMVYYYDNPRDENELANLMLYVLENPPKMEDLFKVRDTFVKHYSPRTIARKYIELFKNVGWLKELGTD